MNQASNLTRTSSKIFLASLIVATLFYLLHLIPIVSKTALLWGTDQWRYFPYWVQIILLILAIISLNPHLSAYLYKQATSVIKPTGKKFSKAPSWIKYPLIAIITFLVMWVFRQRTYFLGDGYLGIRDVGNIEMFFKNEPLEIFIHNILFAILNKITGMSVETVFALISIICGILFVFMVVKFSKFFSDSTELKFFVIAGFMLMGTIQLFFGYAEYYTILTLLVAAHLYFGYRVIHHDTSIYLVTFLSAIAICTHYAGVVLLPSLFYLFILEWEKADSGVQRLKLAAGNLLLGIITVGVIFILLKLVTGDNLYTITFAVRRTSNLIPLKAGTADDPAPFGLFTPGHLVEVFNLYILTAPLGLFALLGLLLSGKVRKRFREKGTIFFLVASLTYFAFTFLFNPRIGAGRDWDLFSPAAIPFTFLSLSLLKGLEDKTLQKIAPVVLAGLVLHTAPWLYLNSTNQPSILRFVKLTESPNWSNYAKGYGNEELGKYYHRMEDYHTSLYYYRIAYKHSGNERHLTSMVSALNNLGRQYMEEGKYKESIAMLKEATNAQPISGEANFNLGFLYLTMGKIEESVGYLGRASELEPENTKYWFTLGTALSELGETESAIDVNKKLIELQPTLWRRYDNLNSIYLEQKDYKSSIELMRKAFTNGLNNIEIYANLGYAYYQAGDTKRSIATYQSGAEAYPDNPDIFCNLGMTLLNTGRIQEGKDALLKALEIDPQHMQSLQTIRRLETQRQ